MKDYRYLSIMCKPVKRATASETSTIQYTHANCEKLKKKKKKKKRKRKKGRNKLHTNVLKPVNYDNICKEKNNKERNREEMVRNQGACAI